MFNPKAPLWMPYGSVRALLAIALLVVVCVLALNKGITGEAFLTIVAVVIGFYFGAKSPTDPNAEPTTITTPPPPDEPVIP
jgi:hypothetical protein